MTVVPSSKLIEAWRRNRRNRDRVRFLKAGRWCKGYRIEEVHVTEKHDLVASEMFDRKLVDILGRMSWDDIFQMPGVYLLVSERLNERVLKELEEERAEERRRD